MRLEIQTARGPIVLDDQVLAPDRKALEALPRLPWNRLAFAAAHLVLRDEYAGIKHSLDAPGSHEEIGAFIDWERTAALRTRLGRLGFGIAEAMDTAQRFFIGWENAHRLIRECGRLELKGGFIAGAGVDHLSEPSSRSELIEGVLFQIEAIQSAGGWAIILPLPQLCRWRCTPEQYVKVYGEIIRQAQGPLFVHWLGEQFLPELAGYFPGDSFQRIMALDPSTLRGVKLSLLDPEFEIQTRRELLKHDQIVLTGDDLHFSELMLGAGAGRPAPPKPVERTTRLLDRDVPLGDFSHALLGVLDGIAAPAALALDWLAHGDAERYLARMAPCQRLSETLFEPPTRHYKVGLAYLSWLAGHQPNRMLVNHEERARPQLHLLDLLQRAAPTGLFENLESVRHHL